MTLGGCIPGSGLPSLPEFRGGIYQLGDGDQIRIITYGVDQLSNTFRINDSGNVALPLLGLVHAAGLTTEQLAGLIVGQLKSQDLLQDTTVSVQVEQYRPIFILGEVNKPGEYPYVPGMTMLTAVAVGGGFTYRAVEDYAVVVRSTSDVPVMGRVPAQALIAPGDVVKILEERF